MHVVHTPIYFIQKPLYPKDISVGISPIYSKQMRSKKRVSYIYESYIGNVEKT